MSWQKKAAEAIWSDLSDRCGFGFSDLEYENPVIYNEIISSMIGAMNIEIAKAEDESARESEP